MTRNNAVPVTAAPNPDTLADAATRERRARLLTAPHMADLTRYVDDLARRTRRAVPYFDPLDGGRAARILILLQSPARFDARPRFVSRDNPVPAQRNLRRFLGEAGLAREATVLWNASPWLPEAADVPDPPTRAAIRAELAQGIVELPRVLALFDDLRAVVLAGRSAQRAAPTVETSLPGCAVLAMPHPSPLAVCAKPGVAGEIVRVLGVAGRKL